MDNKGIGIRLKEARIQAGISIENAADQTGLSKNTIVRIEHGRFKCLYHSTVVTLCRLYGANEHEIDGLG